MCGVTGTGGSLVHHGTHPRRSELVAREAVARLEQLDTLQHDVGLTIIDLKKTHAKCNPLERES